MKLENTITHIPKPIAGGKVKLVPHVEEYFERTVQWLNSPSIRNSFGITRSVTLESHRKWLSEQKDLLIWAILDADEVHRGNISIQITPRHHSAYLQIYIGDDTARGKGLGQNALFACLDYAFNDLKLHRVWLHTSPENSAARSLYRKAGFQEEGVERDSIFRGDSFQDQIRWSILEAEWRVSRSGVKV